MTLVDRLKNKEFTDTEKNILNYIFSHREEVQHMQSKDLANATFTSAASISRLVKKLDYQDYNEFRYSLRIDVDAERTENYADLLFQDSSKTLQYLRTLNFEPYCQLMYQADRIFIYGTDWSERNAIEVFQRAMMSLREYLISIPSMTELKWVAESLSKEDLLILVTYSGENKELINEVNKLKIQELPLISVSPNWENTVASLIDWNLYYHTSPFASQDSVSHLQYNFYSGLYLLFDSLFRHYAEYLKRQMSNPFPIH